MTIILALVGLVLLYFGGEWLIRGASAMAIRLGVSSLAIGLTVVAFGTSAPELVVSVDAALSGANDVAVGNVIGSNIANIAPSYAASACGASYVQIERTQRCSACESGPLADVVGKFEDSLRGDSMAVTDARNIA